MSDLKPLLAGEADELETLLLRAAEDDEPARGALERAAATLGVSATLLAATVASATPAAQAAVAPGAGAVAKPLTWVSLGKWLALGMGVGSVVAGGAHFALAPATDEQPLAFTAPLRTAESATPVAPLKPAVAPSAAEAAAPKDDAHAVNEEESAPSKPAGTPAAAPPSAPAMGAPAPSAVLPGPSSASFAPLEQPQAASTAAPGAEPRAVSASTLGEETHALDSVRAAIAAGHANQALEELHQYAKKWPRGALAMEAALLKVEALLRSGNGAEGQREAEALIARAPRSLYATRARELLRAIAPRAE